MPAVVDQKPTTGTSATEDGVGEGVRVAADLGFGSSIGVGAEVAGDVGLGSEVCVGGPSGQDITMAAIAATPIHRRAIRGPCTAAA